MKKGLAILVAAMLVLMCFGNVVVNAQINEGKEQKDVIITPYYLYTADVSTGLSISGGTATSTCSCTGVSGVTTRIMIYAKLQRLVSGTWTRIAYNSQVYNNWQASQIDNFSVSSGYYYRIECTYTVFSGSNYETITQYSSTVYY